SVSEGKAKTLAHASGWCGTCALTPRAVAPPAPGSTLCVLPSSFRRTGCQRGATQDPLPGVQRRAEVADRVHRRPNRLLSEVRDVLHRRETRGGRGRRAAEEVRARKGQGRAREEAGQGRGRGGLTGRLAGRGRGGRRSAKEEEKEKEEA